MKTKLEGMEDTSVTISSRRACETGKFTDFGWISCGVWKHSVLGKSIQFEVCQLKGMALIVNCFQDHQLQVPIQMPF